MRITCPSCAAEYDVPAAIAPGRVVRCARCGGEWAPVAAPLPVALPAPPPSPEPVIDAVLPPAEPVPAAAPVPMVSRAKLPRSSRMALLLGWLGSLLLLAALAAAAFFWRDAVMQAWPPSIRAYAALGLTARP